EQIRGRRVDAGCAVVAEIHGGDAFVSEIGCAFYRQDRRTHGASRIAGPVRHHADCGKLLLGRPCATDTDVPLAIHGHRWIEVVAVRIIYEPLLKQSAIANTHLIPEYPRARAGRAFRPIAAEHDASMDEGAVVPPPAGLHQPYAWWR